MSGISKINFFLSIPFIIGLILIISGVRQCNKEQEVRNWPWISGTIVETKITKEHWDEGSYNYCLYFLYQYKIKGKIIKNDDYSPSSTRFCRSKKNNVLKTEKRYPKGSNITVFYNPEDPADSYFHMLEGLSGIIIVFYILGAFFILVFIATVCAQFY